MSCGEEKCGAEGKCLGRLGIIFGQEELLGKFIHGLDRPGLFSVGCPDSSVAVNRDRDVFLRAEIVI